MFLKINIEAISFSAIYQSSKKNINTVKSFIGNKIFNPKDFYPTTIKSFLFSPKETILKNIRENKFKTLFYTYLSLVSAHHTVFVTDTSLKLIKEGKYQDIVGNFLLYTTLLPLIYCMDIYNDKDNMLMKSDDTLSGHEYYLSPTKEYIIEPLIALLSK